MILRNMKNCLRIVIKILLYLEHFFFFYGVVYFSVACHDLYCCYFVVCSLAYLLNFVSSF